VSTLDLFDGTLTLVTGPDGAGWARAAGRTGAVPLRVLAADPGPTSALTRAYGLGPGSAVLVRPDGRVAWRSDGACADPVAALARAVTLTLGHTGAAAALAS
jgi:putative polyketide hydroxylase